ncbi:hypothetical protein FHQ26_08675 [Testudinibacter sp. TR-2022]|nr:hypothetical protein FHQ22_01545 [Pasteurellaceae bacterium Phil31]TNH08254.1 hypothetical protein FHQ26_08675 [Testudinibacter sp. TR-2022]TNH11345.1 hypothetical protein FHQ25_03110 [Testudinibacter sp. TR-2022]TNH14392.1 hypothetical protein FIA56_05280 [Testudinibacter sp. TR-2022]TNH20480.1 hypothetical protein FHQ23_01640 [Testudinibacter sp. TR-2022]
MGQIVSALINASVAHFSQVEAELISTPDDEFKFHLGVPSA